MIRTKDFVILLIAILLSSIGAAFFFVSSDTEHSSNEVSQLVYFGEPQEQYGVVPVHTYSKNESRSEFIERVREAYVPQPVLEAEPPVDAYEVTIPPYTAVENTVSPAPLPMPIIETSLQGVSTTSEPVATSTPVVVLPFATTTTVQTEPDTDSVNSNVRI